MLLEKVSIHTEILFVHCYKFFIITTCSFSVFVENCILLSKGIDVCCVPVYCIGLQYQSTSHKQTSQIT
jgi:hypothetical protein